MKVYPYEEELVAHYKCAQNNYEKVANKTATYFMKRVQRALKQKDFAKAKEIGSRCPDLVGQAFIADAIRQAELKAEF